MMLSGSIDLTSRSNVNFENKKKLVQGTSVHLASSIASVKLLKKEFTPKLKFQRAGKSDQQTSHSVINVIMFSDSVDITSRRTINS